MNRKWLLSYRNNNISCRDARGFGGMLPENILKWLMQSGAFLMHYFDRLSLKSTTICYKKNIDYTLHLTTLLLWVILLLEKFKKTCSSWCVFIIFCIKVALVTYWGPHRIIFGPPPPPPPRFREEMDNIYVHFRRVFVEFVVLLTKIWPTNIDF